MNPHMHHRSHNAMAVAAAALGTADAAPEPAPSNRENQKTATIKEDFAKRKATKGMRISSRVDLKVHSFYLIP
jgi:hypothetical protein